MIHRLDSNTMLASPQKNQENKSDVILVSVLQIQCVNAKKVTRPKTPWVFFFLCHQVLYVRGENPELLISRRFSELWPKHFKEDKIKQTFSPQSI